MFWISEYYEGRHFSALLTEWGVQGRTGKGVPGCLLKVTIIRIMIANQCGGTQFQYKINSVCKIWKSSKTALLNPGN